MTNSLTGAIDRKVLAERARVTGRTRGCLRVDFGEVTRIALEALIILCGGRIFTHGTLLARSFVPRIRARIAFKKRAEKTCESKKEASSG